MTPYYIHDIPGRLRVRSPVIKNNAKIAAAIEALLLQVGGVQKVKLNTTTGSCLVTYCPRTADGDQIVSLLHENGYFDHTKAITHDQYLEFVTSKALYFIASLI